MASMSESYPSFLHLVFALIPFLDSPTQMYRLLVPKMILTEPRYVHLTYSVLRQGAVAHKILYQTQLLTSGAIATMAAMATATRTSRAHVILLRLSSYRFERLCSNATPRNLIY